MASFWWHATEPGEQLLKLLLVLQGKISKTRFIL
jgi:hypothetical protein